MDALRAELVPVKEEEKEILRNLLEKYDYEFSQYTLEDVNPLGLFGYSRVDHYWTDPDRWAFFIKVEDKLAGFVMVNDHSELGEPIDYSMAEFCVLYKYRRQGVGRQAAFMAFDQFPGRWELKYHAKNTASVKFWQKAVGKYTGEQYRHVIGGEKTAYADGTPAEFLLFDTAK